MLTKTFTGNANALPTSNGNASVGNGFGRTLDASVKSGALTIPTSTTGMDTTAKQTVLKDNSRKIAADSSVDNVQNVETINTSASPQVANGAAIKDNSTARVKDDGTGLSPQASAVLYNFFGDAISSPNLVDAYMGGKTRNGVTTYDGLGGKVMQKKAESQGMTIDEYRRSLINKLYSKLGF